MNSRCNNSNDVSYKYYGGAGIKVCPEWHEDNSNGFQNFINDMEANYAEGYQLDKDIHAIPNQPKVYSKDICCWVSNSKNNQNRSSTKLVKEDVEYIKQQLKLGVNQADLAKQYNVSKSNIYLIKTGRIWKDI